MKWGEAGEIQIILPNSSIPNILWCKGFPKDWMPLGVDTIGLKFLEFHLPASGITFQMKHPHCPPSDHTTSTLIFSTCVTS